MSNVSTNCSSTVFAVTPMGSEIFEQKHKMLLSVKNQIAFNSETKNQQLAGLTSYFDKVYFQHNQLYNYIKYLFSVTRVKNSAFDNKLTLIKRKIESVQYLIKTARKGQQYKFPNGTFGKPLLLIFDYDCLCFEQYATILKDSFFKKALGRDKWNKLSELVNAYENSLSDRVHTLESADKLKTCKSDTVAKRNIQSTEKVKETEFDIVALYEQMLLLHKKYPELYAEFTLTCMISNEIIALGSSDYADTEMMTQLKDRFDHMIDRVECFKEKQKQDQLANQVQAKLATFTQDELAVVKKLLS